MSEMPGMLWIALASAAVSSGGASSASREDGSCRYDSKAMLRLDYKTFDRDMVAGWRSIGSKPACWKTAADLISRYVDVNRTELTRRRAMELITWHEAQLRAFYGDYEEAASLMRASIKPEIGPVEAENWTIYARSWNEYVRATIAFIENDRTGLERARTRLAELPRPPGYQPSGYGANGGWPENLDVVDGLVACFGLPYRTAYDCERS